MQESIKIPNIHTFSKDEIQDKLIEIVEKCAKENQIPDSALEEVFKDAQRNKILYSLLSKNIIEKQTQKLENEKKNQEKQNFGSRR